MRFFAVARLANACDSPFGPVRKRLSRMCERSDRNESLAISCRKACRKAFAPCRKPLSLFKTLRQSQRVRKADCLRNRMVWG